MIWEDQHGISMRNSKLTKVDFSCDPFFAHDIAIGIDLPKSNYDLVLNHSDPGPDSA